MGVSKLIRVSIAAVVFLSFPPLSGLDGQAKGPGEDETISVGVYDGELSLLVLLAENQGFYEKNGLDVRVAGFEAGINAFSSLISRDVDIATPADFPFTERSLQDDTLRVLASISTADTVEVLARKDKGITQPSDLKGKKIGMTRGTGSETFLRTFLLLRSISPEDVTVIDLSPSQIVEAISRGDIDACITWDSFVYEGKKRMGENLVSWPAQDYQDFFMLLVTRKDVIETKPRAIELFLKSLIEAEEYVQAHEEEVKHISYTRWKREPAYVYYIWDRIELNVCLDQSLIKTLESNARLIKRRTGDSTPIPDYLEFIYFKGLDAVNPKAITIFR